MCNMKFSFLLLVVLVLVPYGVQAEEATHREHSSELEHHQHAAVFVGNTQDGSDNGFSVGVEYEYKISKVLGIGGLVEYAGGDFDSWVIAAPLFLRPYKGLLFILAPGLEFEHSEEEFLFRAGIGYVFEIDGMWSITPQFNVDFVDSEEKFVYGLAFGRGF